MVVTRSQADEKERQEASTDTGNPTTSTAIPARPYMAATASRERVASPARSHRSVRSTISVATRLRTAELEAEEKLAAIRREELQMEAELIRKRLALQVEIIHDEAEVPVDPNASTRSVDDWLRTHPNTSRGEPAANQNTTINIEERLVRALESVTCSRPPPRQAAELPIFTGVITEWLPFKAAMRDSTQIYKYSAAENLTRLRTVVKGEARNAVATLLYSATDPDVIMETLERCFGRPEALMDSAMEDIKMLPRIGTTTNEINMFAARVQNVIYTLKSMNNLNYLYNPLLAREILEKLSPWMRARWNEYAETHEDLDEPKLVILSKFLNREADLTLKHSYTTAPTRNSKEPPKAAPVMATKRRQIFATTVDVEQEQRCPNCDLNHVLTRCPGYKAMNVNQRWNLVREKGMCFRCIDKKHRRTKCKENPCGVRSCRRPHHHTLHEERSTPSELRDTHEQLTSADEANVTNTTADKTKEVLLKVCPVTVIGPRGEIETYALLDEGSTISLIDQELATKIGAEGLPRPLQLRGVNGMSRREQDSRLVRIRLRGEEYGTDYELQARTVQGLSLHKQTIPSELLQYHHLRDLNINQICYKSARPAILVGSDNWELIVSRELRVGKHQQPAASRTQLGWVVHGTAPRTIVKDDEEVLHVYSTTCRTSTMNDVKLHELVETHFKIDALGVSANERISDADQRSIKIFENTIKKIDGGYEVGLPWRYDNTKMPPSYNSAFRRLRSIENKMDKSACFSKEYSAQIENLLNKNYAKPCDGSEKYNTLSWYLPHFAVRNPNKPGKIRLVFDAAARCNGVSLNDKLLEGPDLLLSLIGIMFRFRERPIAVTADIAEMFLQVKIRPEDQPAQLFLWRGADRTNPPQQYKMTSMIFGASSSPFLAHSVRNKNAIDHEYTHPLALKAITQSHYMDDLVDSYNSKEEARQTIAEVREVHAVAGFTMRGWSTNDEEVLVEVPSEFRAQVPNQLGGRRLESKILGIYWNSVTDEIGFNTMMNRVPDDVRTCKRPPTKREALSAIMSIYDPLGLLSHFTIRAKIILQNLWRRQLNWDEPIPGEEAEEFTTWLKQLDDITTLRLPRCYEPRAYSHVELHIFCDASEQAYAAVAYWKITRLDGQITLVLAAAKAKVAPKKAQSIPRLELQAAVIGGRLGDTVRREHRLEISRITYWTDSATVIHWIRNDGRRYTPFVNHRLGELAELSEPRQWRWLPTDYNVADDATRMKHTNIHSAHRWFTGPMFLRTLEEDWPKEPAVSVHDEDEEHVVYVLENLGECLPDVNRFSSFERLVRATARIFLFIDICLHRATCLEKRHLDLAEMVLLKEAQRNSFGNELQRINAGKAIPRSSRLYRLDPELDDTGLLRLRGRVGAANVPEPTKRPIILDGRHKLTRLITLREHCAAGHVGRERVTNNLRQMYWIIRLRPTVRAVEHACTICQLRRTRPRPPVTGDLPPARLDPYHRPFTNCGVDYFGPLQVKVGRRFEKHWVALFTCLTTRALHLEVVASLSTDSAIMALRRMAARRGWPALIYSDNATNFKGADRELRTAYEEWIPLLREEGLKHRIEWRFIPPGAPNQGGAWERLVRSVKNALAITLHQRAPKEEVLLTVLAEAEYSINARPLTHVSVDPADPEALTPNHFLLGSSMGLPTIGQYQEADRSTWRVTQALADHFWKRWVREYLPTLVPRGQTADDGTQRLRVGDVVVIADPSLPRNTWPRGIVVKTYPGPDGGVRSADVKTKNGIFRRPSTKIAVLLRGEEEEASQATPGGDC